TAADVEPETADVDAGDAEEAGDDAEGDNSSSGKRYRTQRRGGMGIRDIKTTARNGKVVAAVPVQEDGQVLMISAKGKIQRISVHEISVVGRNTQGVRIMNIDADDKLAAVVPVPREEDVEAAEAEVDGAAAPKPLPSPDDAASTNGSGGSDE
ncbi:MAG TPA: DNA gyrase C-terminal beta-propeller domain-containing protein, partial [Pirellulales bacterium]